MYVLHEAMRNKQIKEQGKKNSLENLESTEKQEIGDETMMKIKDVT